MRMSVLSVLILASAPAMADTITQASACYSIADADARAACLARSHHDPSRCYSVQAAEKRAECLTPQQLSERWEGRINARTLANWRTAGRGPKFCRLGGRVLYPLDHLIEYERRSTVQSTSQYGTVR